MIQIISYNEKTQHLLGFFMSKILTIKVINYNHKLYLKNQYN
jgi:hypothetical protein